MDSSALRTFHLDNTSSKSSRDARARCSRTGAQVSRQACRSCATPEFARMLDHRRWERHRGARHHDEARHHSFRTRDVRGQDATEKSRRRARFASPPRRPNPEDDGRGMFLRPGQRRDRRERPIPDSRRVWPGAVSPRRPACQLVLKSVTLNGTDITDRPYDTSNGDITGLEILHGRTGADQRHSKKCARRAGARFSCRVVSGTARNPAR